jgi:hypothetical protein
MVQIEIKSQEKSDGWTFRVVVKQDGTQTEHQVEMSQKFYQSLDTQASPEEVVRKSFEFLLENEPKEAILSQFNIEIISQYFPGYKQEIRNCLR